MLRIIVIFGIGALITGCHPTTQPLNEQIANCSSKLAPGHKYTLNYSRTIDTQVDPTQITGNFAISWAPEQFPSKTEQQQAFKNLELFINCVSPALHKEHSQRVKITPRDSSAPDEYISIP